MSEENVFERENQDDRIRMEGIMARHGIKFRKKPVVILAFQNKGDPIQIKTLEGTMIANTGDWIIKGVSDEFYPCKPDVFEKTYEEVSE